MTELIFEEITNIRESITVSNWSAIADTIKKALNQTKTKRIAVPVQNFNDLIGHYANKRPERKNSAGYFQPRWAKELKRNLLSVGIIATEGSRRNNKLYFRFVGDGTTIITR